MKTKLSLTLLLAAILFPLSSFVNSTHASNASEAITDTQKAINLKGQLTQPILRSFTIPFEAFINSNSIYINYLEDLSNITIEITHENGQLVYYTIINPVNGEYMIIDTSDWDEGNYHISFNNDSGGCISGDFEISQ